MCQIISKSDGGSEEIRESNVVRCDSCVGIEFHGRSDPTSSRTLSEERGQPGRGNGGVEGEETLLVKETHVQRPGAGSSSVACVLQVASLLAR